MSWTAAHSENGGFPMASRAVRARVSRGSLVPMVTSWPRRGKPPGDGAADGSGSEDGDLHAFSLQQVAQPRCGLVHRRRGRSGWVLDPFSPHDEPFWDVTTGCRAVSPPSRRRPGRRCRRRPPFLSLALLRSFAWPLPGLSGRPWPGLVASSFSFFFSSPRVAAPSSQPASWRLRKAGDCAARPGVSRTWLHAVHSPWCAGPAASGPTPPVRPSPCPRPSEPLPPGSEELDGVPDPSGRP